MQGIVICINFMLYFCFDACSYFILKRTYVQQHLIISFIFFFRSLAISCASYFHIPLYVLSFIFCTWKKSLCVIFFCCFHMHLNFINQQRQSHYFLFFHRDYHFSSVTKWLQWYVHIMQLCELSWALLEFFTVALC